jgi:hypothetical protein
LWREGDATFVCKNFSRNSDPQGRVGGALKMEISRSRFRVSGG